MNQAYFKSEKFRALLERYEQMLKYSINSYFSADDLLEIASYYLFKNQYADAENVIDYAHRLYPSDPQITEAEIRTLLSKGEVHEARRKLAGISVMDTPELKLLKAEVEIAGGNENTLAGLNSILESTSIRDEIALGALDVMIKSGFYKEALSWVEKGLRRYPSHIPLLEAKADCLVELRRMQEALTLYNQLLDINSYNFFYWEQLGYVYYVSGRFAKALECFEYELTTNEDAEYPKMMKAYCHYYLRDYETAYNEFCNLSLMYPGNVISTFFAALSLCALNRYREAVQLFDELLLSGELTTTEVMITEINKALICDKIGFGEMAEKLMANALSFEATEMNLLALYGEEYIEIHDKDSLLLEHMDIIEREPHSRENQLLDVALFICSTGHTVLAVFMLKQLRGTMYDSADVDAHIAHMLWMTGRRDEAAEYISAAIEGRSNRLFDLFGIKYDADITPAGFAELACRKIM